MHNKSNIYNLHIIYLYNTGEPNLNFFHTCLILKASIVILSITHY